MTDKKKWPLLRRLAEELRGEHYPETHAKWEECHQKRKQKWGFNISWPKIDCVWPAIYVETFTVKVYRSAALSGPDAKAAVDELSTDKVLVIPRRFHCVQCQDSFASVDSFRAHIGGDKEEV